MVSSDFWTTSAQTMPVLALAIVIEARAVISAWTPGRSRFFKAFQGALWAAPLIIYAVATPVCFNALAGKQIWAGWPRVVEIGISAGMGSLVIVPALELLFRTNAKALTSMLGLVATRGVSVSMWRASRRIPKYRRRAEAAAVELARQEELLNIREGQVRGLGHPTCDECLALLAEIEDLRRSVAEQRTAIAQILQDIDKDDGRIRANRERYAALIEQVAVALESAPLLESVDRTLDELEGKAHTPAN